MARSFKNESFEDLDLTRDEVDRIGAALKDDEFRKLLVDYVEELKDPENRKIFQQEVTQLEKERGNDVTFINPVAGYVIKTSVNGTKKGFVNVCSNEHVKKPTSTPSTQDGSKGLQWSLPHTLPPPREDVDNKGIRCEVYDVVFHPDTLYLAQNNKAFYNMVNNTACDAVENNFDVTLDRKNLKFPKMQYKGAPHAAVIRKPSNDAPAQLSPEEQSIMDKVYGSIPKACEKSVSEKFGQNDVKNEDGDYTTPTFIVKHRSHVDLEEFTEHKTAKINTATPKELVVEVQLPLLKTADNITLDVTEKTVQLISEKPAKYKLTLTLPYGVDQDNGNAKFDKDKKTLTVTLPVSRKNLFLIDTNHDSGVESDHGSPVSSSLTDNPLISKLVETTSVSTSNENKSDVRTNSFSSDDVHYILPDHTCHVYENIIAFTLHVKNVDETSVNKNFDSNSFRVKFSSIGSGFYPINYAFYVNLPQNSIDADRTSVEIWDNNVIVQAHFNGVIQMYYTGIDSNNCTAKFIEEPAVINFALENNNEDEKAVEVTTNKDDLQSTKISLKVGNSYEIERDDEIKNDDKIKGAKNAERNKLDEVENKMEELEIDEANYSSKAIDIIGAFSESSGDELSCSYSPSKCKGILKRFSSSRSSVSRSISESSIDDVLWASSFENCYTSLDSVIPEDGEISTSLKKTVRFNDVVSRQLYRSNSSILGQKKKNQRKAKNKKRAQERRHSESELSELEDRKERELKTSDDIEENRVAQTENESTKEEKNGSDIFDLDF